METLVDPADAAISMRKSDVVLLLCTRFCFPSFLVTGQYPVSPRRDELRLCRSVFV
jgi:hypothetical protein